VTDRLVVAHVCPFYREIHGDVAGGQVSLAFRWASITPEHWLLKAMTMQGSPVMHTRNLLTKWALDDQGAVEGPGRADEKGPPADILLWQDADVVATPEEMVELVRVLAGAPDDVGAVAAPVLLGTEGQVHHNISFRDNPNSLPVFMAQRPVECSLAGFGLIATRAAVFHAIGFPWFEWGYRGGIEHCIGEDMGWCEKAKLAGFSVFAHGGVAPSHVFQRKFRITKESMAALAYSQPERKTP